MQPVLDHTADISPGRLAKRVNVAAYVWGLFLGMALLLSVRSLYIAWDDENYIAQFEGGASEEVAWHDLIAWPALLDEPLWKLYAAQVGEIAGPEGALRLTIFLSVLIFLYSATKIGRGAWLFILFFFVLSDVMAVQMYFNQIRQGLALSVFLLTIVAGGGLILAALLASAIHTSFLFVLPCAFIAILAREKRYAIPLGLIATVILSALLNQFLGDLDFGRRSGLYEPTGALNANYYIATLPQLSVVFYLARPRVGDRDDELWFYLALMAAVSALSLTFIHEAAARLMYIVHALIAIVLARNLLTRRGIIAAGWWLTTIIAIQMQQGLNMGFNEETWLGRWILILN